MAMFHMQPTVHNASSFVSFIYPSCFPSTESESFLFFFFFSPMLFFLCSLELGTTTTLMASLFFIFLKSQMGFLLDVDIFLGLFTAFQGW